MPAQCAPYAAVVCAAGMSTRMGAGTRKPYLALRGRPILAWTLAALARLERLAQIVLVTRAEDRDVALSAAAGLRSNLEVVAVEGGARRQDSVCNGLRATRPDAELVLIHDAARPFPSFEALESVCRSATETGAAILACRVRDTIKRQQSSGNLIETTVPRSDLWQAQTPQVFRRALLSECFERLNREYPGAEVTDDAAVLERFGFPVALVESSATNFKVTQPEDLAIAEAWLQAGLIR